MKLTDVLALRRILFSSHHPFEVAPKPSKWTRRERLHRFMAWQYGSARESVRGGYQRLNKTFIYMDMQRKDRPMLEKHYAIQRIGIALQEHEVDRFLFKEMLAKAHILLDDKVLSQMAIYEPITFKVLADLAEKMALEEGRAVYATEEELSHVKTDSRLFDNPLPEAKIYPHGPSENHHVKPRKLRQDEF